MRSFNLRSLITVSTFISLIAFSAFSASTQTKHPGVELFEKRQYKEAASSLSKAVKSAPAKTDASLWNYLGLSYHESGQSKKAIKAFENAIKLDPNSATFRINAAFCYLVAKKEKKARSAAEAAIRLDPTTAAPYYFLGTMAYRKGDLDGADVYIERSIQLKPDYAPAYSLGADVALARLGVATQIDPAIRPHIGYLEKAIKRLETALAHSANYNGREDLATYLENLRAFYSHYSKPVGAAAIEEQASGKAVTPYQILSKPKASYTDSARTAGVMGTVRLVVILGADGKVGPILVVRRLPNGLTENALRAARKIRFTPKFVDGEPVPAIVTLEYGFNIY